MLSVSIIIDPIISVMLSSIISSMLGVIIGTHVISIDSKNSNIKPWKKPIKLNWLFCISSATSDYEWLNALCW